MEAVKEKPQSKSRKKPKSQTKSEPSEAKLPIIDLNNSTTDNERISNSFLPIEKDETNEKPSDDSSNTIDDTISEGAEETSIVSEIDHKPNTKRKSDLDIKTPQVRSEQIDFEKFLNMNKQILDTLDSNESIFLQTFQRDHIIDVKPYNEEQLKALYFNSELEILEDFTKNYVETELKYFHFKNHHLYELLTNYLKVREKITGNNIEIQQYRNEYFNLQSELWTSNTAIINASALCQDGRTVWTKHEYNQSTFHRSVFQNVTRILSKVQELVCNQHILYSYSAEDLRLQIELYVDRLISDIIDVTKLDDRFPVSLVMQEEPQHIKPVTNELRISISILFAFQRKLIRDQTFLDDTRAWLTQLVAVLVRIANYQDHLFLVHHLLRCPAGVGSWGGLYVQTPLDPAATEPFANYQINHLLTLLSLILSPIKDRKEFLKDMVHCQNLASETNWVLVDSDGEEDEETGISLRENDLVVILNQLPFGDMFKCILMINKNGYEVDKVTEQHLLRFLAFASVILKLFHKGLLTYNLPKYNQLSKRLSRFIRHIVQYATDQLEAFLIAHKTLDKAIVQRLQTEYDAFFVRAIYYLYSSQKLAAWQFLAVVPYNMVTMTTLWKIYYFLHTPDEQAEDIVDFSLKDNFKALTWTGELRSQFDEKLTKLADAEIYYLLNTFANMALARNETDIDFIYSCTMDILQVGFISQTTQESCSKSARILLAHILSKYPRLLSTTLKTVHENIECIGGFSLYLYEEIPLSIWLVSDDDFQIIERLLLNYPSNSDQTKLARMILSRLNWDLIPYEKHCDTAILVLKAVDQEPAYSQWGWQTILRLKLHISDRHFQELGRVSELERYDILLKGVRENQPLACFVSVLMTTWGHLVPLICSNGLGQLITLQTNQRHEAVLFVLYQIVPIFITCQECLINSDKFQEILSNLLNADRGYISYAKSFIITQNTVLQQFGNMVETQIVNYTFYGLSSPRLLVRLWMNSLVSIPNWNKDDSILHLLDVLIRTSFFFPNALQVIYENFRDLYQTVTPQESTSFINKFKWSSGNSKSSYSLLSNSLTRYHWLAFVFLEIEHQEKEIKTGLWPELLTELAKQKGKISVDNAIKTAASALKMSSFNSSHLCIYRWAQQAMDMEINHPLLPLMWQKFFLLFLARLPSGSRTGKVCTGDRFFDGIVNSAFLARIKRKLQESCDFYRNQHEITEDLLAKDHCKLRQNIFQAFLLWLEEPRLHTGNLLLHSLPAQYEPKLLSSIIEETYQIPWYDYIDRDQLIRNQQASIKLWRVANFREKSNFNQPLSNAGQGIESSDPIERILRRLNSYDPIKASPQFKRKPINIANIDMSDIEAMLKSLKPCFDTLKQFTDNHNLTLSEYETLDCQYKELVTQLFISIRKKIKKNVPCKGRNQTILCSGPAVITLEFQEAKRNERIDHEIQINRQTYESLFEKCLQSPSAALYKASVSIRQCVRILQERLKTNPETAELGVELFYHILNYLRDKTVNYLPAKTLFVSCIEKLGQSHICSVENEMPRLLELILKEPQIGGYLTPHFLPKNCGSANLLLMYGTVTKDTSAKRETVFALASQFEIEKWLNEKHPNLSQRSQFIGNIVHALSALGFDPPIDSLMLHELYRKHLVTVFEYQFPEHYGEIFSQLLNASNGTPESNLISESVWLDILTSLAKPCKISLKAPLRDLLRQYSQNQRTLSHQELLETANLLAHHFTRQRLSYGLYGLYPKCRKYVNIYSLLLGMIGHGLTVSMLNTHQGLLGDKLIEQIWPYLREMYAPWLVPYSINSLKENMAVWIQQLTDDRSVLMPWIASDREFADKMLKSFCECVNFLLDTLPASTNIFSYLLQWYSSSFAHPSVKDYILSPIHAAFALFPWNKFWPSLMDLEFMLRIIDQYLPECHSFLGHVYVSVSWPIWMGSFQEAPVQMKNRVYYCFLSLLIKLSLEPNVRKNNSDKMLNLLGQAESFDWIALDPIGFQHVMDWMVMSCNSSVIFKNNTSDLDYRLLCFLKIVSGYHRTWQHITNELINKRQIYVRSHVKLLSVYVGRNNNGPNLQTSNIQFIVNGYLNDLDSMVNTSEEAEMLLKEILCVANISDISQITVNVLTQWIENKTYGLTVKVLLKTLGFAINNYQHLGQLFEVTLISYFTNSSIEESLEEPTWRQASQLISFCVSKPVDFENALIEEGFVITLNALLLQRVQRNIDSEHLLNSCIGWLKKLKLSESLERKIPLLWFGVVNLALRHLAKDETAVRTLLHNFAQILLQISEQAGPAKWGRGLLNVIGLTKSDAISVNFRFLCRAMGGYILAQLPDVRALPQKVRRTANAPNAIGTPGGNPECPKVLLELDFGQSQGKIKECAQIALAKIQDPANSLHNANSYLMTLLKEFYIEPYLRDIEGDEF